MSNYHNLEQKHNAASGADHLTTSEERGEGEGRDDAEKKFLQAIQRAIQNETATILPLLPLVMLQNNCFI